MTRDRFRGHILGVGTSSGVRVVVGRWRESPFGTFADCMVADAHGKRWLLAPDERVADYVAATYVFDEVVLTPVAVRGWDVEAGPLRLSARIGGRAPLGRLLRLVPPRVATAPAFCALTDPVARVALRGVRTRGTAGQGRREYYGATDLHRVDAVSGSWHGVDLGVLRPVSPSPDFGFSSTPERPGLTAVTTTVVR